MKARGIEPDLSSYNSVVDAVWEYDRESAFHLFLEGIARCKSLQRFEVLDSPELVWKLDVRRLSPGSAQAAIIWWIQTKLAPACDEKAGKIAFPKSVVIITGAGRSKKPWQAGFGVSDVVLDMLLSMDAPILGYGQAGDKEIEELRSPGQLVLDVSKLQQWASHALLSSQSGGWRLRT
mmetsp:Transcript_40017/g.62464  ORF Transcript_40017/g.62464 Transcript_40017/m.62464 type:complete len:178 (+) Transcript_40017:104-637(+)|eukprot:CAMPEP_0184308084 /NCGR_PEP_ID=MMETSP1049-20130417/16643_1 /TAXON_ID=77928 /ORGANISM="Proteomonas sulcata, Strain CCMP704" /LENGTH=177 /DNA_ID=CAMNT_0026620709 /DNA_START=57 /DNA_END=590 /DNA_ORIENTATION=+